VATIARNLVDLGNPLDQLSKEVLIQCAMALSGTLPWNSATNQYDEATMTFFLPDGRAPTARCNVTVKPSPGLPKVDGFIGALISMTAGTAERLFVSVTGQIGWCRAATEFMVRFDGVTTSRLANGQIVTYQKSRCWRVLLFLYGFMYCMLCWYVLI
jgi:hypothetical protein